MYKGGRSRADDKLRSEPREEGLRGQERRWPLEAGNGLCP